MPTTNAGIAAFQVLGTGSALPGSPLSTDDLLAQLDSYLPPGAASLARRIARRLRIDSRYVSRPFHQPVEGVAPDRSAPQLAARATTAALAHAGLDVSSLRFLLGHTATPHTLLPSNTAWTAELLGYTGPHTELRQACTGFAAATLLARGLIGTAAPVAIVGSETGSVFLDPRCVAREPDQIINMVQMGDGAGAVVLGPVANLKAARVECVFYGSLAGARKPGLTLAAGGSAQPFVEGGGVAQFSHDYAAIRASGVDLLRAGLDAAAAQGVTPEHVDWFLPHQANGRMAEICGEQLSLPQNRVVCEANVLGNLGSAAIWVALDRLRRSGRLSPGDRVLVLGAEATKFMYGGFLYVHGKD